MNAAALQKPPEFRLGLCLNGAVSGGAYLAGAVDFIVQALDAFDAARASQQAPDHEVVLASVAGASSGALTSAVLALALRSRFPHVEPDTSDAVALANPLYDSWVNMTDLDNLLDTRDASREPLQSLLDPSRVEDAARKALRYGGQVPALVRRWVAAPLRVSFTVTNLKGRSHGIAGVQFTAHADAMRYAVSGLGAAPGVPARAGEIDVCDTGSPEDRERGWGRGFAAAALASASFPVALAPRTIERPGAAPDRPDKFAAVDGGVTNNSPFDLVHADLRHGQQGQRNDRGGSTSDRAVLIVSALLDEAAPGPERAERLTLPAVAAAVLRAVMNQARFRPDETALALSPDTYSRFLLAPGVADAPDTPPRPRIAGDFLGGFGGYLSRAFRRHDFLLGRRDAQLYLGRVLTLHDDNPLFSRWSGPEREAFAVRQPDGRVELPIIPLVGSLDPRRRPLPVPRFPAGAADLKQIGVGLDRRLDFLASRLVRPGWRRALWLLAWRLGVRRAVRRHLLQALAQALEARGLA
ncbi:MAG TPA: patatin-like phospholipase family protein [Rhizobacter sp.]